MLALLTVPMMLFILPSLFIVLLGPAIINVIDTFSQTLTFAGAGS